MLGVTVEQFMPSIFSVNLILGVVPAFIEDRQNGSISLKAKKLEISFLKNVIHNPLLQTFETFHGDVLELSF